MSYYPETQKTKQNGRGRNLRNARRKLTRMLSNGTRLRRVTRIQKRIARLQEVFDRA
jgi:hypothetical protein